MKLYLIFFMKKIAPHTNVFNFLEFFFYSDVDAVFHLKVMYRISLPLPDEVIK